MTNRSQAIAQAFAEGSAAYPTVALGREQFASALSTRDDISLPITHGADLFLAIAGSVGDPAALGRVDAILTDAAPSLRRYDSSDSFLTEVLQRVRISMLISEGASAPRIARYDGRASLGAWLGVCVMRMGLYVLRTHRNAREVPTEWVDELAAMPTAHPELEAVRDRYAETFGAAWRGACAALPARQRAVLRMCFVECCSIETIAATYGVHRVTVWRWLEDAKQKLLDGTRARLDERLRPDDPSTQSLLTLVRSKLDLGLSQLHAMVPR
ncbi:MAG: hypothetical protein H0T42_21395 [Deltaproteobacteria bacterium]|nr:hypothetical protein [Deltaproteobacteria bacterium]